MSHSSLQGLAAALVLAAAAAPGASRAADTYAVFQTSRGSIGVRLLEKKAPNAVKNFVELAMGKKTWTDPATGQAQSKKPLYDGTLFHRVIPGFMIQGGDPLSRGAELGQTSLPSGRPFGTGDAGYRFEDELEKPPAAPFAAACQLAMANSGPNTNGSQFFITEVPTPHLNPRACPNSPSGICGYVRFGEGVCGCDKVAEIAKAGPGQTRLEKVVITTKQPTCK
ncbi:MAG TPA: peptidylprolyl isomerase [Anaeromyxobacteraceae bacterium]|nr:peptidylprolyl isomerase [Anaeromyxobacteraceae bacterium]